MPRFTIITEDEVRNLILARRDTVYDEFLMGVSEGTVFKVEINGDEKRNSVRANVLRTARRRGMEVSSFRGIPGTGVLDPNALYFKVLKMIK